MLWSGINNKFNSNFLLKCSESSMNMSDSQNIGVDKFMLELYIHFTYLCT